MMMSTRLQCYREPSKAYVTRESWSGSLDKFGNPFVKYTSIPSPAKIFPLITSASRHGKEDDSNAPATHSEWQSIHAVSNKEDGWMSRFVNFSYLAICMDGKISEW